MTPWAMVAFADSSRPGADTEALNAGSPADDVAAYSDRVRRTAVHVAELSRAANPDEHAAKLVAAFLPDQLRYRPGQPARFAPGTGNGRGLHDDAFGTTLSLLVGRPLGVTTSLNPVVTERHGTAARLTSAAPPSNAPGIAARRCPRNVSASGQAHEQPTCQSPREKDRMFESISLRSPQ
jgi:hypothetical protein